MRVRTLGLSQMTEQLLENRLAIGYGNEDPRDARLEALHIANFEMAVIAPLEHPLARRAEVAPKLLEQEPFIAYAAGENAPSYRYLMQLGVKPNYVMETERFDGIKHAVESGIWISMIMKYMARGELASGRLALTNKSHALTGAEQAVYEHTRTKALAQPSV